jgi:hypothetical protein
VNHLKKAALKTSVLLIATSLVIATASAWCQMSDQGALPLGPSLYQSGDYGYGNPSYGDSYSPTPYQNPEIDIPQPPIANLNPPPVSPLNPPPGFGFPSAPGPVYAAPAPAFPALGFPPTRASR